MSSVPNQATPGFNGALNQKQVDQYWKDGFLFPLRVLSENQAVIQRQALEQLEQDKHLHPSARPLNDYIRVHSDCVIPFAAKLAMNPVVLDMVQSIIGPDIMIWGAEFFIKEAHSPQLISMHQDLTYWGFGETSNQVTAWIALSASTVESGCMDLVRGSHKNPILPHTDTHAKDNMLSRGQEVSVDVKEEDRTHIVLQPGEMSLHHGQAIHGSHPNQSNDRRIGFAIRYISPDAQNKAKHREYAILARGVDRSQAFIHYAPPVALFAPESLTLYDEIRTAQARSLAAGMDSTQTLFT